MASVVVFSILFYVIGTVFAGCFCLTGSISFLCGSLSFITCGIGLSVINALKLNKRKEEKEKEEAEAERIRQEALRKNQEELEKKRKAAEEKAKFEEENTIVLNRPYDNALAKARKLKWSDNSNNKKWGEFLEKLLTSRQYLASKQIMLKSSIIEKCVDFWPAIFEGVTVYTDDDGNGVPDEFQDSDDYFEVETPKKK